MLHAATRRRHGHVFANVKVERGLLGRLLLGIGMHDLKMHRMPAARGRGEHRGRRHVAEQAGSLTARVVGDPADPGRDHDQQKLIATQREPRSPAPLHDGEGAAVAAAEPVEPDGAAAANTEHAGQLPGGPARPLGRHLRRREMPAGHRRRNERRRHEHDPAAVGQVAARLPLQSPNRVQPHRQLVVDGDPAGLDPGMVCELPGHRAAKPGVFELPRGLVHRDGGDAERRMMARRHGRSFRRERPPRAGGRGRDDGDRGRRRPAGKSPAKTVPVSI